MRHNPTFGLLATIVTAALAAQEPSSPPATGIDWKDLTRSGIPIKFYGFFRLDAYYNSARMDSVVLPTRVLPEGKRNDDQTHIDPRLTRLGLDVTPIATEAGKVTGKLEIDFANFPTGSAESRATPRIRLAYVDVARDEWGFRAGQDWDVISPLFPAVNGEMLMWNAGNTGDRRAQIQGRYAPKDSAFEVKTSVGLTGAVNNQDIDNSGERDGFDSGLPHLQVRAGWKPASFVDKKAMDLGLWGMYGRTETDTFFNGENRFDTWIAGIDLSVPISEKLTFRGEAWTGENLGDFRGGIGQTINTTAGREIASTGGFGEIVFQATAQTRVHGGFSIDDPDNGDLVAGNPQRNVAPFLGAWHDFSNGVRAAFDVIYWQTDYVAAAGGNARAGNAVRYDLYFQFNF